MDIWIGSGVWQGWRLTTDHSASSYNQPVLVNPSGQAFGPGDILGEIVGLAEAADILEWSKQQVSVYMSRDAFPLPVLRLASTPIWAKQQILDYKDSR